MEYPDGVINEISPRDHMYNSYDPPDRDGYLSHGRAALDCIRVSLLASQKESAQSILDLPSGHGRVLRFLKAEYPHARLFACDIDHEAVDFCAQAFGATPVYGREHPAEIELEDQLDLIWCGSLFTHLDQSLWGEFLDLFESALVVGGILVFTTCGRNLAAKLADDEEGKNVMKQADRRAAILRGLRRDRLRIRRLRLATRHAGGPVTSREVRHIGLTAVMGVPAAREQAYTSSS